MNNLGALYYEGQGVPQSYERAAELWKQSAAQGGTVSQRDQAQVHMQIANFRSNFKLKTEERIKPHQAN